VTDNEYLLKKNQNQFKILEVKAKESNKLLDEMEKDLCKEKENNIFLNASLEKIQNCLNEKETELKCLLNVYDESKSMNKKMVNENEFLAKELEKSKCDLLGTNQKVEATEEEISNLKKSLEEKIVENRKLRLKHTTPGIFKLRNVVIDSDDESVDSTMVVEPPDKQGCAVENPPSDFHIGC
jgi:regulator of replication initiation timing